MYEPDAALKNFLALDCFVEERDGPASMMQQGLTCENCRALLWPSHDPEGANGLLIGPFDA